MVSTIIVNYNRKDLLRQCLDSLRDQSFKDTEIIVVDNASRDNSVDMINAFYPDVKLVRNVDNLLFCKAQNQGIDISNGDFILCLNSDVMLEKEYLKQALNSINSDVSIGMVSGKLLRMDKKTIDSTGLFLGRNRKAVERGYSETDKGEYDAPEYVFGVSGACAFLRKTMLREIKDKYGYFDERFGMYYEDLDLCWRANKRGWRAYYNPNAVAYHVRGGTAALSDYSGGRIFPYIKRDLKKRYIINRYRCMMKNDSILNFLVNLPFILWYDMKIWCYFVISSFLR